MPASRNDFRWALMLLGVSGAAALGHQLLWTRRMTDLIGASAESNARVLGCFFGGLALGAAVAAAVLPRIRRPWRVVGGVEVGAALFCLPALLLPTWTAALWPWLGPDRLVSWPGAILKWGLSVLVISPPALLMGTTLPLLTSAVCRSGRTLATHGIALYVAHTLGGAAGLVLVVGGALHLLGVPGSMWLLMTLNLVVGVLCFHRDRRSLPEPDPPSPPGLDPGAQAEAQPSWLPLALALVSGAGMLSLEVLGSTLLNLRTPLAFYPPAAILFCVVLLLGASASIAPAVTRRFGGAVRVFPLCLAAAGLAIALAPLMFMTISAGQSGLIGHGRGLGLSLLRLGGVTGATLGPALVLAGMVFPLLLCGWGGTGGGRAGRRLGRFLAINGVGGVLGAEITYRWLLPAAGVHCALGLLGALYGLIALGVVATQPRGRGLGAWGFPLVAVLGCIGLLATALHRLPTFLRTATFTVLEVSSGREGTLAVVQRPDLGRGIFFDNLYLLGNSGVAPDLERQAHLPLLLHPAPRDVGFLGLGTGITAAGALRHGAVQSITVVELSGMVARAAARHFAEFNQGICGDPRARVHVEDAGPYLAAAPDRFDVVVGDLFTPWRPGEARLCSLEQFRAAKAALRPGGVFCQWLPMSQLTREHFDLIASTFRQVFGEVHLLRNHFRTRSVPLALVGFREASLDWEVVAERCAAERRHGTLLDPVCRHPEGLALLYLGRYAAPPEAKGRLNTLANLRVELDAGRQLLAGDPTDYFHGSGDAWLGFLEGRLAALERSQRMPASLRSLPRLGVLASRWERAAEQEDPSAPGLQRALQAGLPGSLRTDPGADPALWPGRPPDSPGR